MKLKISAGAVRSFARLAITARIICGVIVDMPELMNAGWLATLFGAVLALPAVYALSQCRKRNAVPSKILCGLFCAIAICDAAAIASSLADSASYLALNTAPAVYLLLPQLMLCLFCVRLNGDALGASAGVWNKILPWLLLAIVLLQADDYRPEWLTPFLGPGLPVLITGGLRTAGWFILPSALYLIAEPNINSESTPLHPLKTLAICTCFAAGACIIAAMTTPSIPDETLFTRAFRLDALLANGRTGRAQQLPTIALWYLGLFYTLLFDVFTSAIMLQHLRPSFPRDGCIWIVILIIGILGADLLSGRSAALMIADWLYIAQGTLIACAILTSLFRKGDSIHA